LSNLVLSDPKEEKDDKANSDIMIIGNRGNE